MDTVAPWTFELQIQNLIPTLVWEIKNSIWNILWNHGLPPFFLEKLEEFIALRTGFEPNMVKITQQQIDGVFEALKLDIEATKKDPATSIEKHRNTPNGTDVYAIISSHISFHTFVLYRFAHLLWQSGYIHHALQLQNFLKKTGPEIHPGAQIAPGSVIDHGVGTVIGETSIVGENFYAHHGCTIGGIGDWRDIEWDIQWSQYRHPWIGPNVFLGTDVKILSSVIMGGENIVTIGTGSTIDRCILEKWASVWNGVTLTAVNVPADIKVLSGKEHDGKYSVRTANNGYLTMELEDLKFEDLKQRRRNMAHLES